MKRLSTSLLIFILALLAVPDRAWAWTSVELRGTGPFDWTNGTQMTKINDNSFTYEFAASEDFNFKFYVSDHNGFWLGYYDTSSQTVSNYDGNVTYWCNNIKNTENNITFKVDSRYKKYKIDLSWDNQSGDIHYFKYTVTGITEGGSSDPVRYALVGESTNWTWNDSYVFTKTAENTYSLDIAGSTFSGKSFKLMYKEGKNEGWAAGPATNHFITLGEAVSFNGDDGQNYVFPTLENKDYVIELTTTAKTAGSFTVKEKTSAPEKKHTVTISAGEGGTVNPTGEQQIGSTGVEVTATADEGYTFDRWETTDGAIVTSKTSRTTTVTATSDGTLTAYFKPTSTPDPTPDPTPILGNNFYLVGDFLNTDDGINYDCRYFKLSETAAATAARDGVEEYSINIPTTLAVNVQILATDENGSALYGPSGQVTINKNNPSGSGSTTGTLVAATKAPTNYFKFEDRTTGRTTKDPDANDGLYTITVTVTNGVPTNYTITHNPLTRVAYYLPNTSDASVKESFNSRSETTTDFNYVFFGRVYLPANVACYVLSNYLGDYDSNAKTDTKKKLYLQGNRSGGNPDTQEGERNDYTKVYPIIDNNGPTGAQPFVFSTTDIVAMNLEYAPRRGHGDYKAEGITGEVLRSQKTTQAEDGSSIDVPTITELRMVGPAVGDDTWEYNKGVVMNYNMAEQCWEATINTTAAAGAKFRFVANDTWKNSWQENGTEATDKAKIPYDGNGEGHAATPADPNEVSYINTLESAAGRDKDYDIIFNRAPGKWRVRFYFTSKQIGTGDKYTYIFKYTINGYESVVRTYCSNQDEKPTDESIKIYGAYAFKGDEAKKSGTIMLYEMNYIPKNEGVILYSTNAIEGWTFKPYTPKADETKYKNNILDADYHNYLVGTLVKTPVNASEFNKENVRTHRNFFFNYFSKSGCYTDGATDYLGFFRIKSGSPCKANHAYLSLPTKVLAWNGQTFGQVMDQYETTGEVASLKNGMRIVFSDGSDWVEDVPTSITTIKDKNRVFDNYYYTLQGVRVEKPLKGIYIHNGKKVVIK